MHFNLVKNKIEDILLSGSGQENDVLVKKSKPIFKIDSGTDVSYAVCDLDLCKQVLLSRKFAEYQYSRAFKTILDICKVESEGLARFFRNSPLELHRSEKDHRTHRHSFTRVYEEVIRTELKQVGLGSKKTTVKEYTEKFMDDFFGRAFSRILKNENCYNSISHIKGFDVFDILPNPARLASVSRSIDNFYLSFPFDDPSIDEAIRKAPEAFITLLLMGRDPLTVTIASWLNDVVTGGDGSSVGFGSVSAVNFVPRICVEPVDVGEFTIAPGQVAYLLISVANKRQSLGIEIGLAFGYGPHFCLGYKFARELFDRFRSTFDERTKTNILPSALALRNAFGIVA